MALVFVTSCLVAFFIYHWLRYRKVRGPTVFPILGSIPQVLINYDRFYDWITDSLLKFGMSYTVFIPGVPSMHAVVTCNPQNVEHITRGRFNNYPKGPPVLSACHELLGHGIFNSDDEHWRLQRRVAAVEFNSAAMAKWIILSVQQGINTRLMPVLDKFSSREQQFDLQDVLLRYTFDNVCLVACGVDPKSLTPDMPEVPFVSAMNHLTEVSTSRFLVPPMVWKAKKLLRLGDERNMATCAKVVDKFAAEVIQTRRNALHNPPENLSQQQQHMDLLSRFMQLCDGNGNPYSDAFLRDVVINFILAGRDTSAVALAWFFWLLDSHPEAESKILQELSDVQLSRHPQSARETPPEAFSFTAEELKKMHFLHAALTESLRLFPSLPMDIKYATQEDSLPDGTHVGAGFRVFYSIYAMGRMPQIWGSDCLQFNPERWLHHGIFKPESQFKYAVFNAGPRLCLGKDMAFTQMKSVAAAILSQYRVRVVPGHPVHYRVSLTLFMKRGLMVTLQPRPLIVN